MNHDDLQRLLEEVHRGVLDTRHASERILAAMRAAPFEDLGFARVDTHREVRQGFPEVILGLGKTPAQIAAIAERIVARGQTLLVTRATREAYEAVRTVAAGSEYHEQARAITLKQTAAPTGLGTLLVACAGTSDLPVAEEAAVTADVMGNTVDRLYDVGVAGIHRLLQERPRLESARVVIVVAGMEGALPSVVAGLIQAPVIAVPTSIGYGASFGGIAALLGMLNSCANGIAVVNIDNGFGAACVASAINHLC
jgi:pyridinium-3,5-biscarboxylic acid mononucleotide synthase